MAGVSLTDVVKRFGALEVIHGATLEVADGEFVVFVGPSGCGKSTLLRMIAGLEDISRRRDPHRRHAGQRRRARRPRHRDGVPVLRALSAHDGRGEPVLRPADERQRQGRHRAPGRQGRRDPADHAADAAAARASSPAASASASPSAAPSCASRRCSSSTSRSRNLDAELRVQMRVEIARLHAELGVTMIYVTHDQVEAMTLADRIVVLRDGRIEQIGRPLDLYDDPANQFVAGFVGSPRMNFMAAEVVGARRRRR